jgi:hypothetical protein
MRPTIHIYSINYLSFEIFFDVQGAKHELNRKSQHLNLLDFYHQVIKHKSINHCFFCGLIFVFVLWIYKIGYVFNEGDVGCIILLG